MTGPHPSAAGNGATPSPAPGVAAFDFDGTLTRGGSTFPFLVSVAGRWAVWRAVAGALPRLARAAVAGGAAADRAKEELFTDVLGGRPAAEVMEAAERFGRRHLRARLRPRVAARLRWHQQQGHTVLVVSASPECYVAPAVEALGVDGVLATRLAVADGVVTGRFAGRNCRGAEKYRRVTQWLGESGVANGATPPIWAYGNSRGDLKLLTAATHGFDAGRLGPVGRLRRFPRVPAGR